MVNVQRKLTLSAPYQLDRYAAKVGSPPILWKNTVLHLQIFENWKVVL
jgi:hypothetical protein